MQILEFFMYNFGNCIVPVSILRYVIQNTKEKGVYNTMRKLFDFFTGKCNIIKFTNLLAIVLMISTVNSTCHWIHHQPKVPEDAKKYRKF